MTGRSIIVTRAGEAGETLARTLADAGEDALWLPAFTLGPAPDAARLAEVLGKLANYQLAVFVSPAAVEATAAHLATPWPAGTAIGAVGEGTRRAVLARIPSAVQAPMIAPGAGEAEGEGGGSEALWAALRPVVARLRRALILRAEHGREWLAQQLRAARVEVETLAVYTRRIAPVAPAASARIREWEAAGRDAVLVIASSEAVDALLEQLSPIAGASWLHACLALASHERIAERLRAAGFERVHVSALDAEAIRKAASAQ